MDALRHAERFRRAQQDGVIVPGLPARKSRLASERQVTAEAGFGNCGGQQPACGKIRARRASDALTETLWQAAEWADASPSRDRRRSAEPRSS
jgi:hypothetical protein